MNYESIRELAQLIHYFVPDIGCYATLTGETFYANENFGYELIPELNNVISENYYVEFGIKLTWLSPNVSIVHTEIDYIYRFMDNGDINIDISKRYTTETVQREQTMYNKTICTFNFDKGEGEFFSSVEYNVFKHAVICPLVNIITYYTERN